MCIIAVYLEKEQCTPEDTRLVLGSLVGMAVLLLVTIMCFFIWNIYKVHKGSFLCACVIEFYCDSQALMESCGLSPFSCYALEMRGCFLSKPPLPTERRRAAFITGTRTCRIVVIPFADPGNTSAGARGDACGFLAIVQQ